MIQDQSTGGFLGLCAKYNETAAICVVLCMLYLMGTEEATRASNSLGLFRVKDP